MKFTMHDMPIELSTRTTLQVTEARGTTLRVVRGRVWITQEGSVDDVFLDAGSGHTFRADGKVVISSEGAPGDGATVVFDAALSVAARTSLSTRLRRWIVRPATSVASPGYEGVGR